MLGTKKKGILPSWVQETTRGPLLVLDIPNEELAAAWRLTTGMDQEERGRSRMVLWRYDLMHWRPEWGSEVFAWVVVLQNAALERLDAGQTAEWAMTLEDLANLLCTSRTSVYRFVRSIQDEESCTGLRWDSLRSYLRFEQAGRPRSGRRGAHGTVPYTVHVLLEPIVHPKHLADVVRLSRRFDGQRAFGFGEGLQNGVLRPAEGLQFEHGSGAKDSNLESFSGETGSEGLQFGVLQARPAGKPKPKVLPVHEEARLRTDPAVSEGPTGEPSPALSSKEEILQALVSEGVQPRIAEKLSSTEQGRVWSRFWLLRWPKVRPRAKGPGLLVSRIVGAIRGNAEDREEPSEVVRAQQKETRRQVHEEFQARENAARQQKAAATPAPRAAVPVPPELRPLWETLKSALDAAGCHAEALDGARPLRLDPDGLVILQPASVHQEYLRRRAAKIQDAARAIVPTFPDVRFVTRED